MFPEEEEQLLGLPNSNAFLRTCSKPDLNWFMDAVTASLLKLVDESEARSSKESKQWLGACTLGNLMLDPTTRTVSFTESKQLGKDHDNIFTVLAIFLTEFLAMALKDDYSETSKQSRFRTKIAMLFAVEGIHERMRSAFRTGGKSSHKEVWALEVLKQNQRLQETIDGALYVAKPTTSIKEG